MTRTELSIALREQARANGLCDKWYREWLDDTSYEELIKKYKAGIDFAIEKDYPSADFVKENFPANIRRENGVFYDEKTSDIEFENGTYVFNGSCTGNMSQKDISFSNIYVRGDSNISIHIGILGRAHISVFDNATVTVYGGSPETVKVFLYGGYITAKCGVEIKDRESHFLANKLHKGR